MKNILNQESSIEKYFEIISAIPRESENEKAISDFVVAFAKERNLKVYQDKMWNVVIKKPGSSGYENAEPVILQAHMDMVCEKITESDHDFMKDPLELYLEDGCLHAKGTTLGADDGFGVAYILAVLDDDQLMHPPLECVFTTQEENGNWGAKYLDKSRLTSKRMIGLDGDQEKMTFVSCYCSHGMKLTHDYEVKPTSDVVLGLRLTKFYKGVYGGVIHPECGNVIKMMARVLAKVSEKGFAYRIIAWESGTGENFNPFEGKLILSVKEEQSAAVEHVIRKEFQNIMDEFEDEGYRGRILFDHKECNTDEKALSEEDSCKIIQLVHMLPNNFFQEKTINNLGQIILKDGKVEVQMSSRSCYISSEEQFLQQCRYLAELFDYDLETRVRYGTWPYRNDSPLRKLANDITLENWGYRMKEEICPGGLELAWFCEKDQDLDVLMLGPDLQDIHTPDERMDMESFHRVYKLLTCMLELMN